MAIDVEARATGRWGRVGVPLMIGLFVAYLDRTNLSIAIPGIADKLGFATKDFPVKASLALTVFLAGYALANLIGGIATRSMSARVVVISMIVLWSIVTILTGMYLTLGLLVFYRLVLGLAEGVYWPQQSRFARAWFSNRELSRGNAVIQFYGQELALAVGFITLTPLYTAFGWQVLFYVTGGLGLVVVVPLYIVLLRDRPESAAHETVVTQAREPLTLAALGGSRFLLLLLSYLCQGMLFWGITLWIPLAVKSLDFTGSAAGAASAAPYFATILLAIPMTMLSDRTGHRSVIAAIGQIGPGLVLVALPIAPGGAFKLLLIIVAMSWYGSSYTPNIWAIIQTSVPSYAVSGAAGIINGIGAGGGGLIAGWVVGLLLAKTGSYIPGFTALGVFSVIGGVSLLAHRRLQIRSRAATPMDVIA